MMNYCIHFHLPKRKNIKAFKIIKVIPLYFEYELAFFAKSGALITLLQQCRYLKIF